MERTRHCRASQEARELKHWANAQSLGLVGRASQEARELKHDYADFVVIDDLVAPRKRRVS